MNERVFKAVDAAKLDAPERLTWLPPAEVVDQLALRAGENVADIGAGTGYFAVPIANAIGPEGRVFAVDMQQEMLALLSRKTQQSKPATCVQLVLGSAAATNLPDASCDLVLMANVWHELDDRAAVLKECKRILRTSGRLAILDWRVDVVTPPGPPLDHRISESSVAGCLRSHDWRVDRMSHAGSYSYLVMASPTR